jgi:hypothetical protein
MRECCPVAHSEFLGWSLFRHANVVSVVADHQAAPLRLPSPWNEGRHNGVIA